VSRTTSPDGKSLTPSVGVVTVAPVLRQPRYLATGALAKGAVALLLATLICGGCGPIEYLNQVSIKAASAVEAAKLAQADRYAPYEYTAAEEYLHEARAEAGYAQYQSSIEYGRKAEELAHRARAIALTRLTQPSSATPPPPSAEHDPSRPAPSRKRSEDE
jgi:hypothetical protein